MSEELFEYLKVVLSFYGCSFHNVAALIENNISTNQALERRVRPTFMDCHSYRFNLVVRDIFSAYEHLVNKVRTLMQKLSYQVPASCLLA